MSPDSITPEREEELKGILEELEAMNEDAMATEKLAEGIRKFAADLDKVRKIASQKLGK